MQVTSDSVQDTLVWGERFAAHLRPGDVVALVGLLGAGKTHFTKGVAVGLGVPDGRRVSSPTYVLLRCYQGRLPVYHLDAYRLSGPDDIEALGCEDLVGGGGVALVEWADRVEAWLPPTHWRVDILQEGPTRRSLRFGVAGDALAARLAAFQAGGRPTPEWP